MSDQSGELQKLYVTLKADVSDLEKQFSQIKNMAKKSGVDLENEFAKSKAKVDFDNQLAKLKISELQKEYEKLKSTMNQQVKLDVEYKKLEETKEKLDQVKSKLAGINTENSESGSGGLLSMAKSAFAAVMAFEGVRQAINFCKEAISQYLESAKAQAKVEAIIKSTGQAAGFTAKQLGDIAGELSTIAGIDDDKILNDVTANLLTFKNVGGEAFKQTQQAVIDMTAVMGGDLVSRTIMVGKALNDPIQGLTALRRVGVQLSDQQQKQVEDFIKVNDLASAQGIILKELQSEFGGSAKAANDADGGLANLGVSIGNLKEKIGQSIVSGYSPLIKSITNLIDPAATLAERIDTINQKAAKQKIDFEILAQQYLSLKGKINLTSVETETFHKVSKTLYSEYGNYLKSVDLQKDKFDKVATAINNARIKLDEYINSMVKQSIYDANKDDLSKMLKAGYDNESQISKYQVYYKMGYDKVPSAERDKLVREYLIENFPLQTGKKVGYDEAKQYFDEYLRSSLIYMQKKKDENNKLITDKTKELSDMAKYIDSKIEPPNSFVSKIDMGGGKDKKEEKEKFDQTSELENLKTELIKNEFEKRRSEEIKSFNQSIRGYEQSLKEKTMAYEEYSADYDLQDQVLTQKIEKIDDDEKNAAIKTKAEAIDRISKLDQEKLKSANATEVQILVIQNQALREKQKLYRAESKEYKDLGNEINITTERILQAWNKEEAARDKKEQKEFKRNKITLSQMEKDITEFDDITQATYEGLSKGWGDMFSLIQIRAASSDSALKRGFIDMANTFIQQVERMIAQWLAFEAVKAGLNFLMPGLGTAVGTVLSPEGEAANSGNLGSLGTITLGAGGGSGNPLFKDINPVQINNKSKNLSLNDKIIGDTKDVVLMLARVNNSVQAMNMNMVANSVNKKQLHTEITGKLEGKDIYLANKKLSKIVNRNS